MILKLVKFGLVGLASNGILYSLYLGATWAGLGPRTAMSMVYCVGVVQTFYANRAWTFRALPGSNQRLRYALTYAAGYLLNWSSLYVAVDMLEYPHQAAQACLIFVVAGFLFVLQKYWVFPSPVQTLRQDPAVQAQD
jgi:putative flippase GtrA